MASLTSLKGRLKHFAPDWLFDAVFGVGIRLRPSLQSRSPLIMCCHGVEDSDRKLPPGYKIVSITGPSSPSGWIETLHSAGIRVTESTWAEDFVRPASARALAITHGEAIVGTAGVTSAPGWPKNLGLLTWVGVRREHQGRGLSGPLISACLTAAKTAGLTTVLLLTDDHRIPAISTYLRAGFVPSPSSWDWTHPPRWRRILRTLKVDVATCNDRSHAEFLAQLGGE